MQIKNKLLTAGCIAVSAAALLTGLSCNEHELAPFSKSLAAGAKQSVNSGSTRAVDILFVIDNSYSMADEQKSLDENFGNFLDQLIAANADFRIGVVSTDYNRGLSEDQFLSISTHKSNLDGFTELVGQQNLKEKSDKCDAFFTRDNITDSESIKGPWISSTSDALKAFKDNKAKGYNTDGIGAIKSIQEYTTLQDKNILILGAGGASKAISFSLINENINSLTIANRTKENAEQLIENIKKQTNFTKIQYHTINDVDEIIEDMDIIINT